jgi:hypothetical protein
MRKRSGRERERERERGDNKESLRKLYDSPSPTHDTSYIYFTSKPAIY